MEFAFAHTNINVLDLEKSLAFYQKALGLHESRRKVAEDGHYIIVFLTDVQGQYELEITWLRDRKEPYDLSDNEIHVAFRTENYDEALKMHREMGCVCYENPKMGIYFIQDPDGYWMEVIPVRK